VNNTQEKPLAGLFFVCNVRRDETRSRYGKGTTSGQRLEGATKRKARTALTRPVCRRATSVVRVGISSIRQGSANEKW
jgi:hypothetical protein